MMNFHSVNVDIVMDFVDFLSGFLGALHLLNEGQNDTRKIHSNIHGKIAAKSTQVVENGVAKSTLQEQGPNTSCV